MWVGGRREWKGRRTLKTGISAAESSVIISGKDHVRVFTDDRGSVLVKHSRPVRSRWRRAIYPLIGDLMGASLGFRNEQRIYETLSDEQREMIGAPRLFESVPGKYIKLEYVEDAEHPASLLELGDAIIDLLVTFNALPIEVHWSGLAKWLFDLEYSAVSRTLRAYRHVFRYNGLGGVLRFFKKLLSLEMMEMETERGVLAHNDFGRPNVLVRSDNTLSLLDFNDVRRERKWLLIDVVTMAFDHIRMRLDDGAFKAWFLKMLEKGLLPSGLNLSTQLRFAIIARVARLLSPRRWVTEHERVGLAQFLQDVLLDDESWNNWFESHSFEDILRAL